MPTGSILIADDDAAIRTVLNPDKLGHVGEVADAWAVVHEAMTARRTQQPD